MRDDLDITEFPPEEVLDGLKRFLSGYRQHIEKLERENRDLKARVATLESWHVRFAAKDATPEEVRAVVDEWWKDTNLRLQTAGVPQAEGCPEGNHHEVLFWNEERTHFDRMLCLWCGRVRPRVPGEDNPAERAFAAQEMKDEERLKQFETDWKKKFGGGCPTSGG